MEEVIQTFSEVKTSILNQLGLTTVSNFVTALIFFLIAFIAIKIIMRIVGNGIKRIEGEKTLHTFITSTIKVVLYAITIIIVLGIVVVILIVALAAIMLVNSSDYESKEYNSAIVEGACFNIPSDFVLNSTFYDYGNLTDDEIREMVSIDENYVDEEYYDEGYYDESYYE